MGWCSRSHPCPASPSEGGSRVSDAEFSVDRLPFVNDYMQEPLLNHRPVSEKRIWESGCQLSREGIVGLVGIFFFQEAISSIATHFVSVRDSFASPWIWGTEGQWAGVVCTGCTVWLQTVFSRAHVSTLDIAR